jgi:hypothetical protein
MRRLVKSAGTVVVEPDGKSVTIYLKGEGENDFPFQLRKKNGAPFRINFDYAAIIGNERQTDRMRTPANAPRRIGLYGVENAKPEIEEKPTKIGAFGDE